MKKTIIAFTLSLPLILAGTGGLLAAEDAPVADAAAAKCSAATLQGTFVFSYEGATVGGKSQSRFASAGTDTYDGSGKLVTVSTTSTDGKAARYVRLVGKYTVKADCTGTITYPDGTRYDLFVAPSGDRAVFVQTNPGIVATGVDVR